MSVIKVPLSVKGLDKAIAELDEMAASTIPFLADGFMRAFIEQAQVSMESVAHMETGDLKANILAAEPIGGNGSYQLTIDPSHRNRYTGKEDDHYAETEKSRGGDHDFTRVLEEQADNAQYIWESEGFGDLV